MKNNSFIFEKTEGNEWVQPIRVNGVEVEIRNYGIDLPVGYNVGFVVNGNVLERISTGSTKFMKMVGRINTVQSLLGKIPPITRDDLFQHLNIWGNKMITKHKIT